CRRDDGEGSVPRPQEGSRRVDRGLRGQAQVPDLRAGRAFIARRFDGVEDVGALEGGEWSRAFGFRARGRDLVIRFGSLAGGYEPDDSWRARLLSVADGTLDARVRGWRDGMASIPGASARFDEGYAALTELVPRCPEARRVVHGDLTAGNVLAGGDRITGV